MATWVELTRPVEQGCLRVIDMAAILGVTHQRVSHIIAEREDFPLLAKLIGRRRMWRRKDVERWREAKRQVSAPLVSDLSR